MKRVLTALVLIPVVLLIVFKAPLWLFALVVAGIIVLALHEYLAIAEAAGLKPFKWLTYATSLLPIASWLFAVAYRSATGMVCIFGFPNAPPMRVWRLLAILSPIIFGVPLVFRKDLLMGLASAAVSAFGVFYVGASLSLLVYLRGLPAQGILIIFVLFSVWAGDIAAYYVGKNFGRHKLAPIVSPNKSWEGAIASVIASVAIAALVFYFHPQIGKLFREAYQDSYWFFLSPSPMTGRLRRSWIPILCLGILTNVAAQFGDLFESALKRGAGVKDSGTLLPGHGGMLDRIDALLLAIPVVWYYAQITGPLFLTGRFP
jgi:phosphatidate cytidylyltransferase